MRCVYNDNGIIVQVVFFFVFGVIIFICGCKRKSDVQEKFVQEKISFCKFKFEVFKFVEFFVNFEII